MWRLLVVLEQRIVRGGIVDEIDVVAASPLEIVEKLEKWREPVSADDEDGYVQAGSLVLSPGRRVYLRVPQLHAANPERARQRVLRLERRKGLQQRIPVMLDHPPHAEEDCEAGVEHEERLQQVELVPGPALQYPFLGIVA